MTEPKPTAPVVGRLHLTSTRPLREPTAPPSPVEDDEAAASASTDRAPVIRSKIQPPPLRSSTLSRQRLLERLNDAVGSRLTLVVAEAGYGKTTLLADFSSRASVRCLWYKLDPTDADPVTWTNYVIAAAREIDPDFGQNTLSLLAQVAPGGPPESAFVASLLGELPRLGEAPTVLVLDDFHAVDDSDEARGFLARLIKDSPPWLHFVISSRRRPVLELARLAGMGEVVEITTDELRFTGEETERLFAQGYGLALDADVLRDVETRTQGWAASLQLFHGSVRGRPASAVRALAKSLSGATNPIYDFLAQEVLNNLPGELEDFLVRVALLDRVVAAHVVALFPERRGLAPSLDQAHRWIDDCDRLGLLSRASQQSEARHLHPLLRDFLIRALSQRHSADAIRRIHLGLAQAVDGNEPLLASRHYIEAGEKVEAMKCLGRSVMLTMGSGQWGIASSLIDRLGGVPADPAVAAIRARRLIEEGDLPGAAALLAGIDLSSSPADVRAVVRHTNLSLGWRTGDRELLFATLGEIEADDETPQVLHDIFQIFIDTNVKSFVPFAVLARRMERMAAQQSDAGHTYFAAISLHNAALTMVAAGKFSEARDLGHAALDAFDKLPGIDSERFSTHAVLAICAFEQGLVALGEDHTRVALSSGDEHGDVHAECAYTLATTGEHARAAQLLLSASDLEQQGRSDLTATIIATFTRALLNLSTHPEQSLSELAAIPESMPLDTGYDLDRQVLSAATSLAAGREAEAVELATSARSMARRKGARRSEARLGLVIAMGSGDGERLKDAISDAEAVGQMAVLVVADLLSRYLYLLPEARSALGDSIDKWPRRWLPALRKQLDGRSANAFAAATLLDEYGELQDVGRLRAFAKTYGRNTRATWGLGRQLARRMSPPLSIKDMGRTSLLVGDKTVSLAQMRRKPAALLMFLVTRPGFTATREQVIDQLWPDSDPAGASNNLNQSLYFLRRDIDAWYEDDVSVDYVCFQGDVVWLDPSLVRVATAQFVSDVRRVTGTDASPEEILELIDQYSGQFSPEFEYDEWAMAWRSRVHAVYLQFAQWAIEHLVEAANPTAAKEVALSALDRDPDAFEIERRLVGLYWQIGSRSASRAQYEHLAAQERNDGLDPSSFEDVISRSVLPQE